MVISLWRMRREKGNIIAPFKKHHSKPAKIHLSSSFTFTAFTAKGGGRWRMR
jgi:hypothetical protein